MVCNRKGHVSRIGHAATTVDDSNSAASLSRTIAPESPLSETTAAAVGHNSGLDGGELNVPVGAGASTFVRHLSMALKYVT